VKITETIDKLADAYNDVMWNKYSNCFQKVQTKDEILCKVPNDIINVLVYILGYDQAKNWILQEIPELDDQIVVELVKSQRGIKAVKMFVLSMPN